MPPASRSEFLAPAQRRFVEDTLPVSGKAVRIRNLMEGEKEAYEAELLTSAGGVRKAKLEDARRRLVALCLVDASGELLLSPADLPAMKRLDGADMAFLQDLCMRHCGFKSGDIENLVKNSEAVPADGTG